MFLKFQAMVQTQFNATIQFLQYDWGGEYKSLSKLLESQGIFHRISCPYTPQQNGRVKRKNHHVVEMGLSLLAHARMPLSYCPFAFQTASYLINRLPTPILAHKSPYHLLYHTPPSYSHLKIFSCSCFPFLRPFNDYKLQFWSCECVFIGYNSQHKGYLRLDHTSGRIYISRHVVFNELFFPV